MKALKVLNTIALGIPIVFALLGIIDNDYFITALISTMATGFIQVLTGIFFWYEYPKNKPIKIYFLLVAIFFLFLYGKVGFDWFWCMPFMLCLFLSILIYTKK